MLNLSYYRQSLGPRAATEDNLLYGIAAQQTLGASPVTPSCALGTTLTNGDNATSGTAVSLPGLWRDRAEPLTYGVSIARYQLVYGGIVFIF